MAVNGSLAWMPLIHSLDDAATHPDPPWLRPGPQHVEAFLNALKC